MGTLNVYRALASEFYISLTSLDPIGTAFTLSDKLKEMSDQEYEFRAEYIELSDAVEQYAADMLGQARDSEEVRREVLIAPLIYLTSHPFAFLKTAASAF